MADLIYLYLFSIYNIHLVLKLIIYLETWNYLKNNKIKKIVNNNWIHNYYLHQNRYNIFYIQMKVNIRQVFIIQIFEVLFKLLKSRLPDLRFKILKYNQASFLLIMT